MTKNNDHGAVQASAVEPESRRGASGLRTVALAAAAAVVVAGSVTGLFWYERAAADRAALAEEERANQRATAELAKMKRKLEAQRRRIDELQQRLSVAKDAEEVARLKRELQEETARAAQLQAEAKRTGGWSRKKTRCLPGGPICNELD